MRPDDNKSSASDARAADDAPGKLAAALSLAGLECAVEMVDGVAVVTAPASAVDRLTEPAFRSAIIGAARASGALRVAVALGDA